MRITGYEVDWKDAFEGDAIDECLDMVGGRKLAYNHDVSGWVDAKLLIFSSEPLSGGQRDLLWGNGDLGIADRVYEGTFDEIIEQLRQNLADNE